MYMQITKNTELSSEDCVNWEWNLYGIVQEVELFLLELILIKVAVEVQTFLKGNITNPMPYVDLHRVPILNPELLGAHLLSEIKLDQWATELFVEERFHDQIQVLNEYWIFLDSGYV